MVVFIQNKLTIHCNYSTNIFRKKKNIYDDQTGDDLCMDNAQTILKHVEIIRTYTIKLTNKLHSMAN